MAEPTPVESPNEDADMTPRQAAEHLRVIRELMERPVRQTTRSGLAGVIAGTLALAGSAATHVVLPPRSEWAEGLYQARPPDDALLSAGLVWLAVFVIASASDILITWRRARRRGETWWRRAQLQTAMAILPGFVLVGFFTALFVWLGEPGAIPFGWMIGYGMALWTVGMFSITEVKVLGAAFLVAGWLGMLLLPGFPIVVLAVTFGGFHLVYGAVVWARHGG